MERPARLVWAKELVREGQTGLAQADVAFVRAEQETKGLFGLPGLGKGQLILPAVLLKWLLSVCSYF